ncbi:MAG: peroxiredoxin [Cyclobacteriaceae bacterium]|jgi:peroxiredoxin
MKAFLTLTLSVFFSLIAFSQQVKLPRDYQYYFKGDKVTFQKGLDILQKGTHSADISHEDKTVTIEKTASVVGRDFPYKDFVTQTGDKLTIADLEGKILVINYWFVGCRPCLEEMPELNALIKKYDNDKLMFLAIANDPADRVSKFLDRFPFDYTIIPDEMQFGMDLGVRAYPTHMFITPEGKIADVFSGQYDGVGNKISRKIDKLISKWDKK